MPIRPNHVTLLSALFGAWAAMLFSHGTYPSELAAAACYQMAVVLDNCDGEIARAKRMSTPFGAWLDILADFFTDVALFSGLALGLHRSRPEAPALALGLACGFGAIMHLTLVILEKWRGFGPAAFAASNPDQARRTSMLWHIFDGLREGEASWLVILFSLTGQAHCLVYVGAVYMQILWISALVVNYKWLFRSR